MSIKDEYDYQLKVAAEVWFRGGNPDAVSMEQTDAFYYDGVDEFDAAKCLMRRAKDSGNWSYLYD